MKMRISLGPIAGLFAVLLLILDYIMLFIWSFLDPEDTIDRAIDFDYKAYVKNKDVFGDHTFIVDSEKNRKI